MIKPSRFYPVTMDLQEHIEISIKKCDLNLQQVLKNNAVLHGG